MTPLTIFLVCYPPIVLRVCSCLIEITSSAFVVVTTFVALKYDFPILALYGHFALRNFLRLSQHLTMLRALSEHAPFVLPFGAAPKQPSGLSRQ